MADEFAVVLVANMSNPKTVPSCSKPQVQNGWIRKSDLDAWLDRHLPVPTQVISNEEYQPIPQTPRQRLLEQEIVASAERQARSLGMDRRQFLRTSCGMALAFAAMNSIFGRFFRVEAAELFEPAAVAENKARFFIFDVQTHHVAMPNQAPRADQEFLQAVVGMRNMARRMNPALKEQEARIEDAYLENFIKEIFLDSDTDVVALSALPGMSEETDVLTPEVIYKSRTWINDLTGSPRVISHGYFSPDLGQQNLEYMHAQMEKLKIDAWKGYNGVARAKGKQGWRLDDEKLAYPALEYSRKKGIENICVHKGLPFPGDPKWWSPMDVTNAARDFPDLNFLVYHSGFKGLQDALPAAEDEFNKTSYIPWVSDICSWKKKNPKVNNIYMDLALLVSVASNVEAAFGASKAKLPAFRGKVTVSKPGAYPHDIEGPGQATDIVRVIGEALRQARDNFQPRGTVHLFLAVPAGLAVMIGQSLNTFGPIQTYEHMGTDAVGVYEPSARIEPSA